MTIGYPGVPFGGYPQDYYGLGSVFFNSVPPPAVHIHLHLYTDLASSSSEIPSLRPKIVQEAESYGNGGEGEEDVDVPPSTGLATPEEQKEFELWLRGVWQAKEKRLAEFSTDQAFTAHGSPEVVPIKQVYVKAFCILPLRHGRRERILTVDGGMIISLHVGREDYSPSPLSPLPSPLSSNTRISSDGSRGEGQWRDTVEHDRSCKYWLGYSIHVAICPHSSHKHNDTQ